VVALLDNLTEVPAEGAGPLRVTVPVVGVPPITVVGLSVRDASWGARTDSEAVRVMKLREAEIVTVVFVVTGTVVIVKFAVLAPARTVTLAGTPAAELLSLKFTDVSTAALPLSVTVPVDAEPPVRAFGLTLTLLNEGGFTVRLADRVTPR
jgi:hypothetical protein